jgi:hypothetical protein
MTKKEVSVPAIGATGMLTVTVNDYNRLQSLQRRRFLPCAKTRPHFGPSWENGCLLVGHRK